MTMKKTTPSAGPTVHAIRHHFAEILGVPPARMFLTYREFLALPDFHNPVALARLYDVIRREKGAGRLDHICNLHDQEFIYVYRVAKRFALPADEIEYSIPTPKRKTR